LTKKEIFKLLKESPSLITIELIKSLNEFDFEEFKELAEDLEKKYDNKQQSKKNQITSLYGALANEYFPLYDVRLASAITSYGRFYIKSIGQRIDNHLITNFDYEGKSSLIYTHTDSTYFSMKPIVQKYLKEYQKNNKNFVDLLLDKGNEYLKIADAQFQFASKILNTKEPSVLKMKFENIGDKGIWTASANYFIRTYFDSNKLATPKMKIIGMEIVKSSTTAFSKKILKDSLNIFLDNNEENILEFIDKNFNIFKEQKIEDISFNKGLTNLDKFLVDHPYKLKILNHLNIFKQNIGKSFDNKSKSTMDNKNYIYGILLKIDNIISIGEVNVESIENEFNNIINLLIKLNLYNKYKFIIENTLSKIIYSIDILNNIDKNELLLNKDERKYIYKKGTSAHIVGAISYNEYIYQNKIELEPIYNGDKIKYIYLKPNNPFNSHVISFKDLKFLEIIDLTIWIDYDLQYEKSFIKTLSQITNALNIDTNIKSRRNKMNKSYNLFESLF